MIDYLKGTLVSSAPNHVVVEVNGIGFRAFVPLSSYEKLPRPGSEFTLLTYVHVREDEHTLYGFASEEERTLFHLLLSVSGIGPKVALTILSGMEASAFRRAVASGNTALLASIRGIGKKTAERLVVELKDKITLLAPWGKPGEKITIPGGEQKAVDVLEALLSLGYKPAAAHRALQKVFSIASPDWPIEQLLKETLKYF